MRHERLLERHKRRSRMSEPTDERARWDRVDESLRHMEAAQAPRALTFAALAEQNRTRVHRWHGPDSDPWSGADWSNAMCGEAGEAANVVKKLRRLETAIPDGRYHGTTVTTVDRDELVHGLGDELADLLIYADLLAAHYGIDLEQHVRDKFNRVSEAQGFPERL
jgi:NTP pyrophosphatase (non-canonical NTP hydrolase)